MPFDPAKLLVDAASLDELLSDAFRTTRSQNADAERAAIRRLNCEPATDRDPRKRTVLLGSYN